MGCRRERVSHKSLVLKAGDLIAVHLGDRFDVMNLWMLFRSEGGDFLFETSDHWTGYLPADKERWWNIDPQSPRKPAGYAPRSREYVSTEQSAVDQALPNYGQVRPIYSPLRGEGSTATRIFTTSSRRATCNPSQAAPPSKGRLVSYVVPRDRCDVFPGIEPLPLVILRRI